MRRSARVIHPSLAEALEVTVGKHLRCGQDLLFFAGLFIMVGDLVHTEVISDLAGLVTDATGGNALFAVMLILVVSAVLSGIIDNIPYVATMARSCWNCPPASPTPSTPTGEWLSVTGITVSQKSSQVASVLRGRGRALSR